MTVCQHRPNRDAILAVIDDEVRALQDLGAEPHAILAGPDAYEHLRKAIGAMNQRGAGYFETYRYLPIVVDPFRSDELTVLPKPRAVAEGVRCLER
ncbi:MAG: family 4C encapsulin nanocompartment shell protein [Bacteroidota bacterium]